MTTKTKRDIIRIDEDKCDGCGACVIACAEGAIQVIDGKARLVSETYCDGLGACLGECPQDALSIEHRESNVFDEEAVEHHLAATRTSEAQPCACLSTAAQSFPQPAEETLPCGCPGSTVQQFAARTPVDPPPAAQPSMLGHWPVQLGLVAPTTPFLKGADLLLAAHCGPFAYGAFHRDFIKDHAVVCACPKLDNAQAHLDKLTEILRQSDIRSLTVVRMEVPCCGGLTHIARQAIAESGKDIPLNEVTIGVRGDIL